ncbi:MAG: FAD-dependent oxidoreductase [bacterium]|jgi:NADPH-dependent 2,4-dienoyl-CoA reductase/sulfur reductase-like enzyme/rhodanese-related sulfurtransferase
MKPEITSSDFVIVGGVAAGPKTAAVLARRLPNASITLFQKGERLSYASCGLPYFASGDIDSIDSLMRTSYGVQRDRIFFRDTKGFSVVTGAEVIQIDRSKKTIMIKDTASGETYNHNYGKLILATGARPNPLPFPVPDSSLIRHFTTPDDALQFRSLAERGKIGKAAIIGGGFIGCEVAEAAGGIWGIETTLIEKEENLLPYIFDPEIAAVIERELTRKGIIVKTATEVKKVTVGADSPIALHLSTGEIISSDYLFLCLGVRPETVLAKEAGLEIGRSGGIKVNRHLQTSDPDIYAGGDCIESTHRLTGAPIFLPMGSLANRHGWVIAENLAGNPTEFNGVLGTFLLKVFDLNVGAVGLSESSSLRSGLEVDSVVGSFADKPDYYPESKSLTAKMVYEKSGGRLLGLQVVGAGDICRRIDLFSSFLLWQAKLPDLFSFEHGYAPPYAEALDPLHQLASLALAQRRGLNVLKPVDCHSGHPLCLDVREESEFMMDKVERGVDLAPEVLNIPLGSLRARLDQLPRDRKIIVVCKRGPRSYQAALILTAAGFKDVAILGGGVQGLL